MPIFEHTNGRILLVHIPKTGGSAVEHWLRPFTKVYMISYQIPPCLRVSPQHMVYEDIKKIFCTFYGDDYWCFKFAIVRNPYTRIESEFLYRRSTEEFSEWIIGHINEVKDNVYCHDSHLRKQSDYIGDGLKVYKYEAGLDIIAQDISKILSIDSETPFPIHNVSPRDKEIIWTSEARLACNEFYKEDFEQFNYQMIIP